MQIQLNFPDSEQVVAIPALGDDAQSMKYRDGVVVWLKSTAGGQLSEIVIDEEDPYAPGGIVYVAPVALENTSTLEQSLRSMVPAKQFTDDPVAGHWSVDKPYGTCSVCWTDDFHDIHSMLVKVHDGIGVMIETSYISDRESAPWHPRRGEPNQLFALVSDLWLSDSTNPVAGTS